MTFSTFKSTKDAREKKIQSFVYNMHFSFSCFPEFTLLHLPLQQFDRNKTSTSFAVCF